MDSLKTLNWRYATQKFDNSRIIPEEQVFILKQAFNLTPTSYGLQPVKLIVVHNKTIQHQLFEYSYFQPQISTASHLLIFCTETKIDSELIENNFKLEKEIRNTPDEIINRSKAFRLELFKSWTAEQKEKWAVNQLYLTLGNILNICALEGIDACPMEGFEADKYDMHLGLNKKGLKSHVVLPIGYRAQDDFFADFDKVRRPLQETTIDIY